MADLPIVTFGQMISVWEAVRFILEDGIVPRLASAKQIVMETSREGIVLVSGVSGVLGMVP